MIHEHEKRLLDRLSRPELGAGLGLGMTGGGNVTPALDLNFLTGELDSRISFSRGSTASRVNSSGIIETVPADVARFDYDPVSLEAKGLLIEEQRTNLLVRSAEFDNASWIKGSATVITNTATAPDGAVSADKIIVNNGVALGGSNAAGVKQIASKAASAIVYTLTVFAKASEFDRMILFLANNAATSAALATFDLAAGAIIGLPSVSGSFAGVSAKIEACGDGIYRAHLTATSDTDTIIRADFWPSDSIATTGDGASGIWLWGAQLETGAFATSHIPTAASQVTRSADRASMSGTAFSGWWNASEGTIILSVIPPAANRIVLSINDGSNDNRYLVQLGSVSQVGVFAGNINQGAIDAGDPVYGYRNALAYAYRVNDTALSLNGGLVAGDTSVISCTVTRMDIGTGLGGATSLCGHILSMRYFRVRVPNNMLSSMAI